MSEVVEGRRDVVTIGKLIKAVRGLKQEGKWPATVEDQKAAVVDRLIDNDPQAFADPSLDWDAVIAFIEKMLPLILKIIALFGV